MVRGHLQRLAAGNETLTDLLDLLPPTGSLQTDTRSGMAALFDLVQRQALGAPNSMKLRSLFTIGSMRRPARQFTSRRKNLARMVKFTYQLRWTAGLSRTHTPQAHMGSPRLPVPFQNDPPSPTELTARSNGPFKMVFAALSAGVTLTKCDWYDFQQIRSSHFRA